MENKGEITIKKKKDKKKMYHLERFYKQIFTKMYPRNIFTSLVDVKFDYKIQWYTNMN